MDSAEPAESVETGSVDAQTPATPEQELAKLAQERDQFRDQFLRMAAELENFRKRVSREREESFKYANLGLISDLLPALDNLQRAIDAAAGEDAKSGVLQGVRMVLKQFEEILGRNGAVVINAAGEPFDPNLHEALQQRPDSGVPPMTVIDVLEQGYKLHDRVIRPSKVIVSTEEQPGSSGGE